MCILYIRYIHRTCDRQYLVGTELSANAATEIATVHMEGFGRLLSSHDKCLLLTDTSRLPHNDEEQNEGNYVFVTYESMLADIAMHAYLEYGSYDGSLYGTKLDTIHQIHADGLIAVIDVEPQVNNVSLLIVRVTSHELQY